MIKSHENENYKTLLDWIEESVVQVKFKRE